MKKEFDGISRSFFLYEHVLKAECSPFAINRIKRHCCTFEGTDLVRKTHEPTSKLRSHNAAHLQTKWR